MKKGLPRRETPRVLDDTKGGPPMLYVGMDLSRKRLDWQALDREGERVAIGAVPPTVTGWPSWSSDWAMRTRACSP
jgi:hypothetical protein